MERVQELNERRLRLFVGHYGISFLAKSAEKSIPLWTLFLAVQIVDIGWAILVLLGIEKVRIVPGFTATNPLDLYYMPYTHSLPASFLWFGLAYAVYKHAGFSQRRNRPAVLVALAVISHWLLDLIVHRPDLPLYDDTYKVGLGLWNYPVIAFLLEALFLFGGMSLYLRSTKAKTPLGTYGWLIFGGIMLGIQASVFFGPPPPSTSVLAVMALGPYFLFAGMAFWLERKRT